MVLRHSQIFVVESLYLCDILKELWLKERQQAFSPVVYNSVVRVL